MSYYLMIIADAFAWSDLWKLLGIVAAAVVLFLLGKRFGSGGDHIVSPHADVPEPQPVLAAGVEPEGPDPDQPNYTPPPDDDTPGPPPEHIRLENWNFAKFELETGPLTAMLLPTS